MDRVKIREKSLNINLNIDTRKEITRPIGNFRNERTSKQTTNKRRRRKKNTAHYEFTFYPRYEAPE